MFPLLFALACAKTPAPTGPQIAPARNVYLRNSFDTDPSSYLGRFLPAGVTDLDEGNGMTLACSKHITTRRVEGGGVRYSELFQVSSAVSARFGVPVVAQARGGAAASRTARVQYELTGKLIAEITDPDAFAACCKAQPDQCSDRMVGEFIEGRGSIFFENTSEAGLSAEGRDPGTLTGGGIDASRSSAWTQAAEFDQPVFFAFKVTPTPYTQQAVSHCPEWVDRPPQVEGGQYVVGRSRPMKTEDVARRKAQNQATLQAVRASGTFGAAGPPALRFDDWCVETASSGGEARHTASVLAFLSDAELERLRTAAASAAAAEPDVGATPAARRPAAPTAGSAAAGGGAAVEAPVAAAPAPAPSGAPTTARTQRLLQQLQDTSFSDDQINLLVGAAPQLRVTCAEVRALLDVLSFDQDKVRVALALRSSVLDPENADQFIGDLSFASDQQTLRAAYR